MEKNATPPASALPRRDFLKRTATAAAAAWPRRRCSRTPVYGQNQAPSANVAGANNRIQVAIIGVGFGIGQNHLVGIHENANAGQHRDRRPPPTCSTSGAISPKPRPNLKDSDVHDDYRKMLDRKDIDAVLVATHDPWHAQTTIDSLDSGRHVYCEKPLTRYLGEAFQVYDKVKGTGQGLPGRARKAVRRAVTTSAPS